MITIYHNPRCSKSRETLEILESKKVKYEIVKYLDVPLGEEKLSKIIKLLNIKPIELIRKNESIWKEKFKNLNFSDEELIHLMTKYPKLIERPIVINDQKAIIGRPPKRILDII